MEFKDALRQPVEIGRKYGYSSSSGSWITVVVGTLIKVTEKKVTLQVVDRRYYLYGEETTASWKGDKPTVSVHPCHLFPIKD